MAIEEQSLFGKMSFRWIAFNFFKCIFNYDTWPNSTGIQYLEGKDLGYTIPWRNGKDLVIKRKAFVNALVYNYLKRIRLLYFDSKILNNTDFFFNFSNSDLTLVIFVGYQRSNLGNNSPLTWRESLKVGGI